MKNTKIKFVYLYKDQWGHLRADVIYKKGTCRMFFNLNEKDGDKLPMTAREFIGNTNHCRIYKDDVFKTTGVIYE